MTCRWRRGSTSTIVSSAARSCAAAFRMRIRRRMKSLLKSTLSAWIFASTVACAPVAHADDLLAVVQQALDFDAELAQARASYEAAKLSVPIARAACRGVTPVAASAAYTHEWMVANSRGFGTPAVVMCAYSKSGGCRLTRPRRLFSKKPHCRSQQWRHKWLEAAEPPDSSRVTPQHSNRARGCSW